MNILVNIMVHPDDNLTMSPDEIAEAILEGLNGDRETDVISVHVQVPPETATIGGTP